MATFDRFMRVQPDITNTFTGNSFYFVSIIFRINQINTCNNIHMSFVAKRLYFVWCSKNISLIML